MSWTCSLPSRSSCPKTCLPCRYPWGHLPHRPYHPGCARPLTPVPFPQMAIIVLAILLFLAAMLFILMNWYYRTV